MASMYKNISEILEDVSAGRLTPEQADAEIEQLRSEQPVNDAQGIPFEHAEQIPHAEQAKAQGSAAQRPSRSSVSGIFSSTITFDVDGNVSGIIGGGIAPGVHIGGKVDGMLGGGIGDGAQIDGNISGTVGGSIGREVIIRGKVSGPIGGGIGKGAEIRGDLDGPVGGNMDGHVLGRICGPIGGNLTGTVDKDVLAPIGGNMSGEIGGNLGNERTRTKRMLGGDLRGHVGGSIFGKVMGDVTGTVDGDVTEIKGDIAPGAVIKGRVDRLHGKNIGTVLGGIVRMG